jgi:LEA14-like dessication related protein
MASAGGLAARGYVLAAIAIALSACANMPNRDPVEVYVVGIEPMQGQGLELRMLVKLRVQNPNDTPIEYNGVAVAMEVDGRTFASGVSDAAGTVPRFGERVISVPVSISALRALRSAAAIAGTNAERISYRLKGKLAGPVFNSVRFTSTGEVSLPKDVYGRGDQT